MISNSYRLGIDAGGTFTDFVIADHATGEVKLFKALSTPSDPTRAIQNGLKLIAADLGKPIGEIVSNCDLCINGTTVGLNALITHRGGTTGLICTAGHEDSIEIRNGHKEDGYRYDPEYPAATMLVPRYLRCGVRERIISDGSVRTPLHEDDVRSACRLFLKEGVETVAISFVWSVLDPRHERRAAEIAREMMPDAILTVGSELYPQVREYTRTSTAVTNAYLAPVMRRYVNGVDTYFRQLGAKQPVRYFQSNGGLAIGQAMTDRSVYAINSGPASAPQAGLYVGGPFGHGQCHHRRHGRHVLRHHADPQRPDQSQQEHRLPALSYRRADDSGRNARSRWRLDRLDRSAWPPAGRAAVGRFRTGPRLLRPGRHRTDDIGCQSGARLSQSGWASWRQIATRHGQGACRDRYYRRTAGHFGRAGGLWHVCHRQQQHGQRHPPRIGRARLRSARFVLVGAGGATAAHIIALAREMGINTIILPKLASGLCAFGQVISDVKYNYMAPAPVRLDNRAAYERIDSLFREIEAKGIAHLKADGFPPEKIDVKRSLDMRYVGQVHECTVDIDAFDIDENTIGKVKDAFHSRHEELYTYAERHSLVEVVNLESTIYGRIEKPRTPTLPGGEGAEAALKGHRDAIFDPSGKATSAPIYDGSMLGAGARISGPAIIEEVTTTIVVEPGWTSILHESGSYLLTRMH